MKEKPVVNPNLLPSIGKALLVLILIAAFVSVSRGVTRMLSSRDRVQNARERLEEAKRQQENLKAQLEDLNSNFYKEKVARDQLGLAKPGEIVIVLPEEDLLRRLSPRALEVENIKSPEPNWKKWAKLFFEI